MCGREPQGGGDGVACAGICALNKRPHTALCTAHKGGHLQMAKGAYEPLRTDAGGHSDLHAGEGSSPSDPSSHVHIKVTVDCLQKLLLN